LLRIRFLTRCKQRIISNPPQALLSALYSWQRIKGEAYRGHGGITIINRKLEINKYKK
jgi:hypothetical protein